MCAQTLECESTDLDALKTVLIKFPFIFSKTKIQRLTNSEIPPRVTSKIQVQLIKRRVLRKATCK